MAKSFRELPVWNDSIDLAEIIYGLCRLLPPEEKYGLSSQMQRSAVSIASNIAEGFRRRSDKDFIRFLCIARGSGAELEAQLEIVVRVFPKLNAKTCLEQIVRIDIQLNALISVLQHN